MIALMYNMNWCLYTFMIMHEERDDIYSNACDSHNLASVLSLTIREWIVNMFWFCVLN